MRKFQCLHCPKDKKITNLWCFKYKTYYFLVCIFISWNSQHLNFKQKWITSNFQGRMGEGSRPGPSILIHASNRMGQNLTICNDQSPPPPPSIGGGTSCTYLEATISGNLGVFGLIFMVVGSKNTCSLVTLMTYVSDLIFSSWKEPSALVTTSFFPWTVTVAPATPLP